MANMFRDIFYDYISNHDITKLFDSEQIIVNSKLITILRCVPDIELLTICKNISEEKAKYTMDQNQRGYIRSQGEKEAKQLEGIIAETYSQILLMQTLKDWQVLRYDLERDTFNYSTEEYDIKIVRNDQQLEFEIRNSYSYKTTISEAYCQLDILGAYVNHFKKSEEISDFFIRPLSQLNPIETWRRYPPRFNSTDELIDKIVNGNIINYLCCGTNKTTMLEKGYESNFNQGYTKYLALKMRDSQDIISFIKELQQL